MDSTSNDSARAHLEPIFSPEQAQTSPTTQAEHSTAWGLDATLESSSPDGGLFGSSHSILHNDLNEYRRIAGVHPNSTSALSYSQGLVRSPAAAWVAEDFFSISPRTIPLERQNTPHCLTESEAELFHHFIRVWGPLLDATDASKQFSTSIPHLAWTESPCLMYAILALVTCQLCRTSNYSAHESRSYREKCAQVLVPVLLTDPERIHEASIFATYVLLRVYDHLQFNGTYYLHSVPMIY